MGGATPASCHLSAAKDLSMGRDPSLRSG